MRHALDRASDALRFANSTFSHEVFRPVIVDRRTAKNGCATLEFCGYYVLLAA
jgi:hypothetical protein